MIQPTHIKVEMKQATAEKTKQYFYVVNQSEKIEALKILAQELKPFLSIIFVNTQDRVEFVTEQLQQDGYEARALHGGLSQNKREQLMEAFRQMKFQYLVCTDIASRGVDVEGVTHVFNFDLPSDTESYIHRVGRTGRAGQEGTAITFVSPRQKAIMAKIESAIKQKIDERILTGVKGFAEIPKHKKSKRDEKAAQGVKENRKVLLVDVKKEKEKEKEKRKIKPGYKKKAKLEKERTEKQEKRKRVQQAVNQTIRSQKTKEARERKS